jgi:hypothetical protein
MSLGAGVSNVRTVQIGERTGGRIENTGRKESLRAESDGAIGDGGAERDAGQIARITAEAGKVDDVARLGDGDVDGKNRGVGHAVEREDVAVEVGDRDHHPGAGADREADGGARAVGAIDGVLDDRADVVSGKCRARERAGEPAIGGGRAVARHDLELAAECATGARTGGADER